MSIERLSSALADRYRIERELGAGGMATVYLAHDTRHDRKVAIKVLKPELAAVLGAERFVVEIKTTASLQHPHILPLFDSGTADGFLFYVMPYIQGETIREKLNRETQFGVDEAVRIAREVADALDYAHRHGVIHRDIKPENILLHDGRAMVMDFGIALAVSAAAGGRMTETGLSLGTPHYMSPEQATAEKEITGRTDVYSLASVLYEMLTGETPHMGNSAQQIIMKIITEPAPLVTTLRKSVPRNVVAAVAQALEKLPADRFTSAAAFGAALADSGFGASFASGSPEEMARLSWKKLALVASGAAVISLAVAGWAWLRPGSTSDNDNPWRMQLAMPDSESIEWGIALSADGSKFVHDGGGRLWLRTASSTTSSPIAGTEGGWMPSLSPDGKRVAFIREAASAEELVVMALEGGAAKVVARTEAGIGGVWTDDDHIAYSKFPGYSRIRVSDGTEQAFTTADSSTGEKVHLEASALPGGNGLLFAIAGNNDSTYIAVTGPDGGRHTRLLPGVRATFAPPGHLIVTRADGSVLAMPFDVKSLRITGPAVSIISLFSTGIQSTLGRVVVADNGRAVYVAAGRGGLAERPTDLVWVSRAGVISPVDTSWVGMFLQVVLSRDGTRAAVDEWTANLSHLLVRDMASGSVAEVSLPNTMVWLSAFAHDSRRLYFIGNNKGSQLYRVDPSDAALAERVLTFPGSGLVRTPVLDPSGENLYFTRGSAGADELVRMKSNGSQPPAVVVVPGGQRGFAPQVSPDGRWLAFLSNTSGRTELHVRSTDLARSGDWRVAASADIGGSVRWSRAGDELFYAANGSLMAARVTTTASFEAGAPRALFSMAGLHPGFDVGADGRFLMIHARPDRRKPTTLVMLERWTDLLPK